MSSPQTENGYTKIANEIMEALARLNIGLGNAQILYAVLRKTYGWQKKQDAISLSQLSELTHMSKRNVIYCLQNLEAKKILNIRRAKGRGHINLINTISFNKNYDKWVVKEISPQWQKSLQRRKLQYKNTARGVVKERGGSEGNQKGVVKEIKKKVGFPAHTKETITKETIQKKSIFSKEEFPHFSNDAFKDIWEAWLEVRDKKKTPNTQRALKIALNKLHKYPIEIAIKMLEEAVESGWKGIYPLKEQSQGGQYGRSKRSSGEDKYKGIGTEIRDL